jgi:predicted Zn-ribbon and HTH transcriptional regulator
MPDIAQEDLVKYGVIALVAILVIWGISKLMPKKEATEHMLPRSCKACGWSGRVSKFNLKCPKCNAALGAS